MEVYFTATKIVPIHQLYWTPASSFQRYHVCAVKYNKENAVQYTRELTRVNKLYSLYTRSNERLMEQCER